MLKHKLSPLGCGKNEDDAYPAEPITYMQSIKHSLCYDFQK